MKYYIESMEHSYGDYKVWWKPNRLGYTHNISEAGLYSKEEAEDICQKAGLENECMWSEHDMLDAMATRKLFLVMRVEEKNENKIIR